MYPRGSVNGMSPFEQLQFASLFPKEDDDTTRAPLEENEPRLPPTNVIPWSEVTLEHNPADKSVIHKLLHSKDQPEKPVRFEFVTGKKFNLPPGAFELDTLPEEWLQKYFAVRRDARAKQQLVLNFTDAPPDAMAVGKDKKWQSSMATFFSIRFNVLVTAVWWDEKWKKMSLVLRDEGEVDEILESKQRLVWQGPWVVEALAGSPSYKPTHESTFSKGMKGDPSLRQPPTTHASSNGQTNRPPPPPTSSAPATVTQKNQQRQQQQRKTRVPQPQSAVEEQQSGSLTMSYDENAGFMQGHAMMQPTYAPICYVPVFVQPGQFPVSMPQLGYYIVPHMPINNNK